MDTVVFKKDLGPRIASAINDNGGLEQVRKVYGMMPSIIDFVTGWVVRDLDRPVSQEEIRRIYDLVRLTIDTGSATS